MFACALVPVFILILTVCINVTTDSSFGISYNIGTHSNTNIIGLVSNTSIHMNTSIRRNMNLNNCFNTNTNQHTDANMNTHINIDIFVSCIFVLASELLLTHVQKYDCLKRV